MFYAHSVEELDLFGLVEAAALFDVERSRIGKWRHKGVVLQSGERIPFPDPVYVVRATPLWRGGDLRALQKRREEPPRFLPS